MSKPNTESKNKFVYLAFGVLPVIWAALMVAPFIAASENHSLGEWFKRGFCRWGKIKLPLL